MAYDISLLDLPDLVLHNICTFITDPFDLLHLGSTCSRLKSISSLPSLWWPIALEWCDGLWMHIEFDSSCSHPREWLIAFLKYIYIRSTGTEKKCIFSDGEEWERVDSPRLRCIYGMMHIALPKKTIENPAVLYEQWLYDIGLYRRVNVHANFAAENFEFSQSHVNGLSKLGQAVERDLRRRKQPNKDPKYYLKRAGVAYKNWMTELFPTGLCSTTCPFLMCPFYQSVSNETTGLQGLAISLSLVIVKLLKKKNSHLFIKDIHNFIKSFNVVFIQEILDIIGIDVSDLLKPKVLTTINQNSFKTQLLQTIISMYKVNLSCKEIIIEFSKFIRQYEGIDYMVDKVRFHLRESMFKEINQILFKNDSQNSAVVRINLTDSDLIGGDNYRQEMASAAFIADKGVLVTWHLTGRTRF